MMLVERVRVIVIFFIGEEVKKSSGGCESGILAEVHGSSDGEGTVTYI